MVTLLGIIIGISAVLAVIVSAGVIGACMLVAWLTGNRQAPRGPAARAPRGGGRHGNPSPPFSGNPPPPFSGPQRPQDPFRAGRLPSAHCDGVQMLTDLTYIVPSQLPGLLFSSARSRSRYIACCGMLRVVVSASLPS